MRVWFYRATIQLLNGQSPTKHFVQTRKLGVCQIQQGTFTIIPQVTGEQKAYKKHTFAENAYS